MERAKSLAAQKIEKKQSRINLCFEAAKLAEEHMRDMDALREDARANLDVIDDGDSSFMENRNTFNFLKELVTDSGQRVDASLDERNEALKEGKQTYVQIMKIKSAINSLEELKNSGASEEIMKEAVAKFEKYLDEF